MIVLGKIRYNGNGKEYRIVCRIAKGEPFFCVELDFGNDSQALEHAYSALCPFDTLTGETSVDPIFSKEVNALYIRGTKLGDHFPPAVQKLTIETAKEQAEQVMELLKKYIPIEPQWLEVYPTLY